MDGHKLANGFTRELRNSKGFTYFRIRNGSSLNVENNYLTIWISLPLLLYVVYYLYDSLSFLRDKPPPSPLTDPVVPFSVSNSAELVNYFTTEIKR